MTEKNPLGKLTKQIIAFRDAREWRQFHNPKDVSLSLVLEAAEVMEHFQWKSPEQIEKYLKTNKSDVAEEMADVLIYLLTLANDLEVDVVKAAKNKLKKSETKYPISKSKGNNTKYTKL